MPLGGSVEFCPTAKAEYLWHRLADENKRKTVTNILNEGYERKIGENGEKIEVVSSEIKSRSKDRKPINLFMAVPTVYAKMIETSRTLDPSILTSVRLTFSFDLPFLFSILRSRTTNGSVFITTFMIFNRSCERV